MAIKKMQININGEQLKKKLNIRDGKDGAKGLDGKNGVNGITPDTSVIAHEASKMALEEIKPTIPTLSQLEEKMPELGEPIRDALELLPEDSKLKPEAIHNIVEFIENIAKKFGRSGATAIIARYLSQIGDVVISGISDGQVLKYQASTKTWINSSDLNAITSVSNSDGSMTISPTTGDVVVSLNTAHTNTWTAQQNFNDVVNLGTGANLPKLYLYNDGTYIDGWGQYTNEFRNFFDTSSGTKMTWGKQTPAGSFTELMRLDSTGLGIGKTPSVALDVQGDTKISDSLVVGSSASYGPLDEATGGTFTQVAGSAYTASGIDHYLIVLAYQDTPSGRIYADNVWTGGGSFYIEQADNGGSPSPYDIEWSWNAVANADGYVVSGDNTQDFPQFQYMIDVGNVTTWTQDFSDWTVYPSFDPTPLTSTSYRSIRATDAQLGFFDKLASPALTGDILTALYNYGLAGADYPTMYYDGTKIGGSYLRLLSSVKAFGNTTFTGLTGTNSTSNGVAGGVGSNLEIQSGTGGTSTVSGSSTNTGGAGGTFSAFAYPGGFASGSTLANVGGAGGAFSFTSGQGGLAAGSGTNATGGASGAVTLQSELGGSAFGSGANSTGGAAGIVIVKGGTGGTAGSASSSNHGGAGGSVEVYGGDGGAATGTGAAGGNAGTLKLYGGTGGSTNGNGGSVYLYAGPKNGSGSDGNVYIGVSAAGTATGNVAVGHTNTPSAKLHLIATSNLFRAGYDTSNYFNADVSSTGTTTFDAVGSGASFIFSDAVTINGLLTLSAQNIATDTTTGMKIGTGTTQKIGFYNKTPVVQPTALTTQLTDITFTAPGTPDYAIQNLTNITPFGFVTQDEGNTFLSVVKNLQTRVSELESKLQSLGLLA